MAGHIAEAEKAERKAEEKRAIYQAAKAKAEAKPTEENKKAAERAKEAAKRAARKAQKAADARDEEADRAAAEAAAPPPRRPSPPTPSPAPPNASRARRHNPPFLFACLFLLAGKEKNVNAPTPRRGRDSEGFTFFFFSADNVAGKRNKVFLCRSIKSPLWGDLGGCCLCAF